MAMPDETHRGFLLPSWPPVLPGASFTGAIVPGVVALTDGASIAVNAALGNDFRVTIAASRTLANPSGPSDGQVIRFQITQGTGGPFTITWGSAYDFGTAGAPALSAAAGATDVITAVWNAANASWLCTAALGF